MILQDTFCSKRATFPRSIKRLYQLLVSSFLIDCIFEVKQTSETLTMAVTWQWWKLLSIAIVFSGEMRKKKEKLQLTPDGEPVTDQSGKSSAWWMNSVIGETHKSKNDSMIVVLLKLISAWEAAHRGCNQQFTTHPAGSSVQWRVSFPGNSVYLKASLSNP